ncbi:MAG: TonB-dependent receptor [Acidobacteriota bacterium]|nr:TonB-dependent receptor [Acidobacteriota bacterium]
MLAFRCSLRCFRFHVLWIVLPMTLFAADRGSIRGTVTDALGAVVSDAKVELIEDAKVKASTTTDEGGQYRLPPVRTQGSQLRVSAPSFRTALIDVPYAVGSGDVRVNVSLAVEALAQQITVTATGMPTPQAQVGAAVSVLDAGEYPYMHDVQEALRLIPGLQITQTGQRGATTSLFIRGGYDSYNKVLVDGVPANDIGGAVEFGNLALAGIGNIEVLRAPNSALYGADALAGVVSLNTSRGTTRLPQVTYRVGGGNFGTYEQEATLGGAYKQVDYFSDFLRFDTANSVPNSSFHNGTFSGNFGWRPFTSTSLRATVRRVAVADGNPNAIDLYGIPDDAVQKSQDTLLGVTLDNQTTDAWHNLVRYSGLRLRGQFTDYSPTGIPYDSPFLGTVYIGAPVTIRGANGYTVNGQAEFQFPGTYPNRYVNSTDRDLIYAQSDYKINPHTVGLVAFKYEHERGFTLSGGFAKSAVDRRDYSSTIELNGDLRNRLHYSIGTGVEDNAVFGTKATPRVALAYYLVRPGLGRWLSGTKLRSSFSSGIKEPSIFYQTSSLYALLAALPDGLSLISQYHVSPIGAERARTFDGGIDQELFAGRARMGVTYFHNRFSDGIEFVPQQGLVALGVPGAVVQATQFGAAVNSQSLRTQGAETDLEYKLGEHLSARGGYTYLDAVVERSFSSDALFPSQNPAFPSIAIGAFSPLKGARPFRRAPHAGYFGLYFSGSRWQGSLTGTLVGRRDDSDFLFDKDGGATLLLPNRNLDSAYHRVDASASYRVNKVLSLYGSFQNILGEHYSEAFGFPSLPFTFSSGIRITVGGESWKVK